MSHCTWNRAVMGLPATTFKDCGCSRSRGSRMQDLIKQGMMLEEAFDATRIEDLIQQDMTLNEALDATRGS
jgi:hypothetical protein